MSLVVAIKDGNKVYLGADSQVTRGGTRSTLKNPNNYKIWKVNGVESCLMAHVGAFRDANVIRLVDDFIDDYDVFCDRVDYRFVVKCILPRIIAELRCVGFVKPENPLEILDSSFIFIYKDKVFKIGPDCSVTEIDDYVAMGSGCNEAIGSLLSTEGQSPVDRIIKAIKAGAANDIYVDYPIIITDSESTKFTVINESDCKEEKGEEKNGKKSQRRKNSKVVQN